MKTDLLPAISVDQSLLENIEHCLKDGETVTAFVEASVRAEVRRRLGSSDFIERAISSLAAARTSGHYVSADAVVRRLQERLREVKGRR